MPAYYIDNGSYFGSATPNYATYDQVYGGANNDSISLYFNGSATIYGGGGNDDVVASGQGTTSGYDFLYGGSGNDTIYTHNSSLGDNAYGGAGNDKLTGAAGNDYLDGGAGNDTFIFGPGFGKDVIADFHNTAGEQDIVQIDRAIFADFDALQSHMSQVGSSVVITLDSNDTIELQNMNLQHLTVDDFRFV